MICPECGKLVKLPKYPVRDGFYCDRCDYVFFRPEQYRIKELRKEKKNGELGVKPPEKVMRKWQ